MLIHLDEPINLSKKERVAEIKKLQSRLATLQQKIKAKKIPVIILVDGWSASGKGTMIGKIASQLESRGFQVAASTAADISEARRPYLWRFWRDIPSKGNLTIFEKGWYRDALEEKKLSSKENLLNSINTFEKQLAADGYLVVKFFLQIDKDTQYKRLTELEKNSNTAWRVNESDFEANKDYDSRFVARQKILAKTSTPHCPWNIVENNDKTSGTLTVLRVLCQQIEAALAGNMPIVAAEEPEFPVIDMENIEEIDLSQTLTREEYKKLIKKERAKLEELHSQIYQKKIPVTIAFEGWDAAGKGSAIRRLTWALDPRGFVAHSIAAPTSEEGSRHYLWRFWNRVPKNGHIAIFDRSWYGRVMVEKLEGFTPVERCNQAYSEICEFEKELTENNGIVLKFWLQVDKDTQLERFTLREETPEKQHKITDEDWRNREKWDLYQDAVNEMIAKTSTPYAPWVIVPGNDKKFARVMVLKTLRKALEKKLDEIKDGSNKDKKELAHN